MNVQQHAIDRRIGSRLEELEALLEQLASLAEQSIEPAAFCERLVAATCHAAAAKAGCLLSRAADGTWHQSAACRTVDLDNATSVAFAEAAVRHHRILWVSPGGRITADGPVNPSADWLLLSPVTGGLVLELALAADKAHDRPLLTEIARSFAEVGRDFFEGRELGVLRHQAFLWKRLETFVRSVHHSLTVGPTTYAIANEGRLVAGCDRLSLTLGRGRRVAAVSGVEIPDRRSNSVAAIGELAAAAVATGELYWELTESTENLPPRLGQAWNACRETNGPRRAQVAVLRDTLGETRRPIGALIAEWFEDESSSAIGIRPIAEHAESALSNALNATPGPVGRVVRGAAAPFRRRALPVTATIGLLIAAAITALCFWPAEFSVDARGRVRPAVQREVFAPRDGIVRTLRVEHGATVSAGDTLLVLSDPSLDLDLEQVLGDMRTARQRLISVQAARTTSVGGDRASERGPVRTGQLAGEEKELEERLAGLEKQLKILERERDALKVLSPIDGVVLTWETDQRLEARPVRRGQRLLTVAQPAGEWLVELFVPDRRIGHVLEARRATPQLPIDYLIATDPSVTRHEVVEKIALSTEPHEGHEPTVMVTARLARDEAAELRPGSTVVGRIHCGTRPIGYVWFHDVYESIRTRFFF